MGQWLPMTREKMYPPSAREAEGRGEMPLDRAVKTVHASLGMRYQISRPMVREFLVEHCGCGSHDLTMPGGVYRVNYYATALTEHQRRQLLSTAKW